MKFVNLTDILQEYADTVTDDAKLNLKATQTRQGIRINEGFKTIRKFKSNSVASGNLYNSIESDVDKQDLKVGFEFLLYGEAIDQGRSPTQQGGKPSKLIPAIDKWIVDKGIKPRDLKTGKYLTLNKKVLKQMSFLIARKIHRFGFKGTNWWQDALDKGQEFLDKELELGILRDVDENIIDNNN